MRRLLVACLVALVAGVVVSIAAGGSSGGHSGRWVVWDLGTLGGPESVPADINERLQVVGSSDTARKVDRYQYESDAFLWGDWRMRSMGAGTSAAVAINERGQIAGSHRHAFLWQDGQMRDLGTLGGKSSEAVAINERGQVAGRAYTERKDSGGYALEHAFLWTGGRMVDLTARSDDPSWAVTLNDRGQVLVKSLDQDGLWEKGRFVPLEGKFGAVVDLNERGQVLLTDMIWQQGRAGRGGSAGCSLSVAARAATSTIEESSSGRVGTQRYVLIPSSGRAGSRTRSRSRSATAAGPSQSTRRARLSVIRLAYQARWAGRRATPSYGRTAARQTSAPSAGERATSSRSPTTGKSSAGQRRRPATATL